MKVDPRINFTSQAADKTSNYNEKCGNEIYSLFNKVFINLNPSKVHNYYCCTEKNCREICYTDLKNMSKENEFKHKWLFDTSYAFCDESKKWKLVYIQGKGMFCAICREFDAKQKKMAPKYGIACLM